MKFNLFAKMILLWAAVYLLSGCFPYSHFAGKTCATLKKPDGTAVEYCSDKDNIGFHADLDLSKDRAKAKVDVDSSQTNAGATAAAQATTGKVVDGMLEAFRLGIAAGTKAAPVK